MRGDKLVIEEEHASVARQIYDLLEQPITESEGKFVITIAGESGSGKTEIATVLSDTITPTGATTLILQQDDYFVYPPKTNEAMRRKNIGHVGTSEVKIDLLDQNLKDIVDGKNTVVKPLVIFDDDTITEETVEVKGVKVVIVEGTYTTLLKNAHRHVFIDRDYIDTRAKRLRRAREKQDRFLENVLEIEHDIISAHKAMADIIVTRDFQVVRKEIYDS
ncbi:MAG: zeta toxin family protein [Dehalococcoidia bacterium]